MRDAARAHVGALSNAPAAAGVRKRAILTSPHGLNERQIFDMYRKERPEVAERLVVGPGVVYEFDRYDLDFAEIESFTGMKKSDYHTTEQVRRRPQHLLSFVTDSFPALKTFLDALDSVLALEKDWKAQGFVVKNIPLMQA